MIDDNEPFDFLERIRGLEKSYAEGLEAWRKNNHHFSSLVRELSGLLDEAVKNEVVQLAMGAIWTERVKKLTEDNQ